VRAGELFDRLRKRVVESGAGLQVLFQEVGDYLGVGVGVERVSARLEACAEVAVVFDDAVVDDDEAACAVGVRVGVGVAGAAVSGPARVADALAPVRPALLEDRRQRGELALALADGDTAAVLENGDADAVVAAVLKAAEGAAPCCTGLLEG